MRDISKIFTKLETKNSYSSCIGNDTKIKDSNHDFIWIFIFLRLIISYIQNLAGAVFDNLVIQHNINLYTRSKVKTKAIFF